MDYNEAIQTCRDLLETGFWVLDTETTGLGSSDQVIEIGITDENGASVFGSLVMPTVDINPHAAKVNGLTKELIADNDPITQEQLATSLAGVLSPHKPITVVIHNAPFDVRMLKQSGFEFPSNVTVVCSMALSKVLTPKNVKLDAAHRALDDCRAVAARIRQFAAMEMIKEADPAEFTDLTSAANLVLDIDATIKGLKALRDQQAAQLVLDMQKQGLVKVATGSGEITLSTAYKGVKIAPGHTIEDVAKACPTLVELQPKIKSSASRSLPKIVRENKGEIPSCLKAEVIQVLKVKPVKKASEQD